MYLWDEVISDKMKTDQLLGYEKLGIALLR